jgi:hypothetical protein
MRNNHKWNRRAVYFYRRAVLSLGMLSALVLALGAGRKWG